MKMDAKRRAEMQSNAKLQREFKIQLRRQIVDRDAQTAQANEAAENLKRETLAASAAERSKMEAE